MAGSQLIRTLVRQLLPLPHDPEHYVHDGITNLPLRKDLDEPLRLGQKQLEVDASLLRDPVQARQVLGEQELVGRHPECRCQPPRHTGREALLPAL